MRFAFLLPLLGLAACTTRPDLGLIEPPPQGEAAEACHGESLAAFVGQPRSEALGRQMLAASDARTIRWVARGQMVTMEFSAERLTVYLDAAQRVERANCG